MFFCTYKSIFGNPGEGFHKHYLGVAMGDLLGTILIIFLISWFGKYRFWDVFVVVFLITIVLHRLFCVNTTINKLIFGTV